MLTTEEFLDLRPNDLLVSTQAAIQYAASNGCAGSSMCVALGGYIRAPQQDHSRVSRM